MIGLFEESETTVMSYAEDLMAIRYEDEERPDDEEPFTEVRRRIPYKKRIVSKRKLNQVERAERAYALRFWSAVRFYDRLTLKMRPLESKEYPDQNWCMDDEICCQDAMRYFVLTN